MIAFMIWCLCGCMFIGFGVASFLSKKPTGFWANSKMFEVTDTKKYNFAMGKLWCVFGCIFIIIGIPLLAGQNSPWGLVSVIGSLLWAVALMIIYEFIISKKYKKQ